jgi:hypothetical protein
MMQMKEPDSRTDWVKTWRLTYNRYLSTPHLVPEEPEETIRLSMADPRLWVTQAKYLMERVAPPSGSSVLLVGDRSMLPYLISRKGNRVTEVTKSEAMIDSLTKCAVKHSMESRISVIAGGWEHLDTECTEKYPLLVAPYSLFTPDLEAVVRAVNTCCSGRVVLFWHGTPPPIAVAMKELWPKVLGCEFNDIPHADCLYRGLRQLGVPASIVCKEYPDGRLYPTLGHAVMDLGARMGGVDEQQDGIIREYLRNHLNMEHNGLRYRGKSMHAEITWTVG